jgi:uncharacterized membrane protein YjfL (UPF0719 family)
MPLGFQFGSLFNAVIYAVVGIALLAAGLALLSKVAPFAVWREIVDKQNTAAAVLAGFVALGVAIIIAATMH